MPLAAAIPAPAQPLLDPEEAVGATRDLYAKLSARDLGVLRYVPAKGFSEVKDGSDPHRIDASTVEKLFASPMKIELRADNLQSELFGNVVLVTGMRVGSITPPGQTPMETHQALSVLWTFDDGRWQMRHVHLSSKAEGR
jgi:hypothetical protein